MKMKQEDIQRLLEIHTNAESATELRRKLIEVFPDTVYSTFTKKGHETITTKPCEYCGNDYIMNLKNRGHYCSRGCASNASIRRESVSCLNCDISFIKKRAEIKNTPNHFCSQSCAATYHNKQRVANGYSTKGKTISSVCIQCSSPYDKSIHSSYDICEACSELNTKQRISGYEYTYKRPPRIDGMGGPIIKMTSIPKIKAAKQETTCEICGINTGKLEAKYCDTCRTKKHSTNRIEAIKSGKTNFNSIKCDYIFNGKTIHCDSKLEYSCLNYFEANYQVIDMERAQTAIPYTFNSKKRLFLPDFQITTINTVFIVECKSDTVGKSLNEKWRLYKETAVEKKKVLFEWCATNGYTAFWYEKKLNGKFYNQLNIKSLVLGSK